MSPNVAYVYCLKYNTKACLSFVAFIIIDVSEVSKVPCKVLGNSFVATNSSKYENVYRTFIKVI